MARSRPTSTNSLDNWAEEGLEYYLWDYYHLSEVKPIGLDRVTFTNELATKETITITYTDPI